MSGDHAIRPASSADLEAVARLHRGSWEAANAPHLPNEVVASNTHERRLATWRRILSRERAVVFVAEIGERIVGVAAAGPARDRDVGSKAVGESLRPLR